MFYFRKLPNFPPSCCRLLWVSKVVSLLKNVANFCSVIYTYYATSTVCFHGDSPGSKPVWNSEGYKTYICIPCPMIYFFCILVNFCVCWMFLISFIFNMHKHKVLSTSIVQWLLIFIQVTLVTHYVPLWSISRPLYHTWLSHNAVVG